ncbi:serine protease 53-like [Sabethes cyaneus]|uniref:serine protease 53-like n=1 Tax=Sabethes cyaneus TaxID=53552 RepID=UPI00237DB9AE|nr:serine protease 53-like [Sabethes cyaneus]
MLIAVLVAILNVLTIGQADSATNALYQCGIRKRFGIQLIHHGWIAEKGQWPWHVALYHRTTAHGSEYRCGGTLIDQRHILTSAHCVVRSNGYPMAAEAITIHLGQYDLQEQTDQVQIMSVAEVHVHSDFETNRNDIALLVLKSTVQYSDYVIPICLDRKANSRDEANKLEGLRGSVTGWGQLANGSLPRQLRTAEMPIVSHLECVQNDPVLFGRFLNPSVFCAGDKNGTSVCKGDSGGGMYVSEGDRWILKGIVSFSGLDKHSNCDTSKFVVFANVVYHHSWISNLTRTDAELVKPISRRISEIECDNYKSVAKKKGNGICYNSRNSHSVAIWYEGSQTACSGVLVSESFVLLPCHCASSHFKLDFVRIGDASDYKVGNVTCHPTYSRRSAYHDLALIQLDTAVRLTPAVLPACLANNWTENLYETLLVTGHVGNEARPEFLETVENRVIAKDECNRMNIFSSQRWRDGISEGEVCVLNDDPERENSFRLPGAALQTMSTRTCMVTLLGIQIGTSTDTLAQSIPPLDVYSRVAHNLDWIEQVVWGVTADDELGIPGTTEPVIETELTTLQSSADPLNALNPDFVYPDHPALNRTDS